MERLRNLSKFENGSKVGLDVENLVGNLVLNDKIKVLTTVEMWKNGTVPEIYSQYARIRMPQFNMVNFMKWQEGKEAAIIRALDSGLSPSQMGPIHANLDTDYGLFSIAQGITRIRVYSQRGIDYIPARLYLCNNSVM